MALGIFGDSYAYHKVDHLETIKFISTLLSWSEYLEINHGVTLTNHGMMGSSVFYSYSKFLEHHEKYDSVVFISTNPDRINIPPQYLANVDKKLTCFSAVTAEMNINSPLKEIRTIASVAIEYYTHLHNELAYRYFANLMVADIRRICEKKNIKLLIIPGFTMSQLGGEEITSNHHDYETVLGQITYLENTTWGIDDASEIFKKSIDIRTCHLTDENNKILARKIADWLNGNGFNLNVSTDFVKPKLDDMFKYFIHK